MHSVIGIYKSLKVLVLFLSLIKITLDVYPAKLIDFGPVSEVDLRLCQYLLLFGCGGIIPQVPGLIKLIRFLPEDLVGKRLLRILCNATVRILFDLLDLKYITIQRRDLRLHRIIELFPRFDRCRIGARALFVPEIIQSLPIGLIVFHEQFHIADHRPARGIELFDVDAIIKITVGERRPQPGRIEFLSAYKIKLCTFD